MSSASYSGYQVEYIILNNFHFWSHDYEQVYGRIGPKLCIASLMNII